MIVNNSIDAIDYLCHIKGIDLDFHVTEKLKYNKTRPYKHGKEC